MAGCGGGGGGVARSSSSLTAALVPSPAAVSVASGPASTPAAASMPAQSQAAAPQSFVYEHDKTYAVLDTCLADRAPRAQTTHDAARSVT